MGKINLKDNTFVIPLRVDSPERVSNLNTVLALLLIDFETNIIILEADSTTRYTLPTWATNVSYHFIHDDNAIFHRTKYINLLLKLSTTKYIGIWDTDVIVLPSQIYESVCHLRKQLAIMVFPYSGKFYSLNYSLSEIFRQNLCYGFMQRIELSLPLQYGYHSVGGAFLVNKEKYLYAGGENENIYGWGPEDMERVKRLETLDFNVIRIPGSLFHLWHPIFVNSRPANMEISRKNRKEFIQTCKQ